MPNKVLKFWEDEKYYHESQEGSLDFNHPGMKILTKIAKQSKSILDLGCGEGTRLNYLSQEGAIKNLGVDISSTAIKIAKKQYPRLNFISADSENLHLGDKYELVYSAYVLEHITEPESLIKTALNIAKEEGKIIFIAPNFGAPNRRSPNSVENKFKKLWQGFLNDFKNKSSLNWVKVKPLKEMYEQPDDDALEEPYLLSLIKYLKQQKHKIVYYSSCWDVEKWSLNPRKLLLKILGLLRIYPFNFWGPHLIIIFEK